MKKVVLDLPSMTTRRPASSGGRLFFTIRHAIHTDMHTRLSTTLRPLEGRTSLGK
jgi:hypothetical protein